MNATRITFFTCLFFSIALIVVGFVLPPTGVIDGSVLTAVGEIFGFATLGMLPNLIRGRSVELKHGQTTLCLGDDDSEDEITDNDNNINEKTEE